MSDTDTVAEAIWRANPDYWSEAGANFAESKYPDHFRRMAQAAIDALGLKQEKERHKRCVCRHPDIDHDMYRDGKCGANTVTRHTPCACAQFTPQNRVRLVSPWTAVTS